MRVERTEDTEFIWSVLASMKDELFDGPVPKIPLHEQLYYLTPIETVFVDPGMAEDVRVGCVFFVPVNSITWNPHIAVLPEYRGRGTEVMNLGVEWMFANTPCRKMVAYPPVFNKRVIRVFEKCGFNFEGMSPNSFLWHGELHDRLLMGKEKPQ